MTDKRPNRAPIFFTPRSTANPSSRIPSSRLPRKQVDVMETEKIQTSIMKDIEEGKTSLSAMTPLVTQAPTLTAAMRSSLLKRTEGYINRLEEDSPIGIKTSTFSSDRIRCRAAVEISDTSLDPSEKKGVNSLAMGTVTVNQRCTTCQQAQAQCPGHPGYINLNTYILNPEYERIIMAIFNCVCPYCSYVPMTREVLASVAAEGQAVLYMNNWTYLSILEKKCEKISCMNPNTKQTSKDGNVYSCVRSVLPKVDVSKSKNTNCITTKDGIIYNSRQIFDIFNGISRTGAKILGFNDDSHPRDLIMDVLAVTPPITRPPLYEGSVPSYDALTLMYQKVVRLAESARTASSAETSKFNEQLRETIKCIIVEDKKSKKGSKGQQYSILLRFKGKDALIRGAVHGKRTDYTARGVLSPASYLRFGELAIPQSVASIWAIPETVTQANIEYIRKLFQSGRVLTYTPLRGPNAGNTIKVTPNAKMKIRLGDKITRWVETGDYVVFNRQPTLHHPSYLGYTAVVVDDRETIGLHPSATAPHNADFDGDTAMIGVAISGAAKAEIRDILHISNNLMDPAQNKPLVGLIMDSITSAYLMTKANEGMEPFIFTKLYGVMETPPDLLELQARANTYGLHPWSGRTLFSALLPKDFYYDRGGFKIRNGILVSGRVLGSHIGSSHRSIIQDLYHQYGDTTVTRFITNATWLLLAWGDMFGFSVGIADCEYAREAGDIRDAILSKIEEEIDALGPRPKDPTLARAYESRIQSIVDQVKPIGKELAFKYMTEDCPLKGRQNSIGCMAKEIGSGAKSDLFNIAQIGGSVGQQSFADQRMVPTMNDGRRSLPTQPKRPADREAPVTERGFVAGSYMDGMTPDELYSILRGGLQGQIDTNLSTADVGAMQRLAAMAGLNIAIRSKGEIATPTGLVYSFVYGGDGLEPKELLNVKIPGGTIPSFCDLGMIIDQVNTEAGWIDEQVSDWIESNKANAKEIELQIEERKKQQILDPPSYQIFSEPTPVNPGGYYKQDKDVERIISEDTRPIIDLIKDTPIPIPDPIYKTDFEIKKYSLPKTMIKTPIYSTQYEEEPIQIVEDVGEIPPLEFTSNQEFEDELDKMDSIVSGEMLDFASLNLGDDSLNIGDLDLM